MCSFSGVPWGLLFVCGLAEMNPPHTVGFLVRMGWDHTHSNAFAVRMGWDHTRSNTFAVRMGWDHTRLP